MRKQVQSEIGKAELDKRIEEYEALKKQKEDKIVELKSKIDAIERRDMERREIMANKRKEDLNFIKAQEGHLARFLKEINKESKWFKRYIQRSKRGQLRRKSRANAPYTWKQRLGE